MGRWIGIDYGTRRIGVAITDPGQTVATPARILDSAGTVSEDARRILQRAADNQAEGIVLGLPLNMDGSDSSQTALVRALAGELRKQAPLPVELWDERLSSFQADQHLDAAGVRAAKRRSLRDALAAQVILQSFLDARRKGESPDGFPKGTD
jgi:putative Holliday junction resolvase